MKLTPGTFSPTLVVIGVGAVSASQNYILKFSLIGSNICKSIGVYLRQSLSPYNNLTPTFYHSIKTSRTENEILFSAPTTESNASIGFATSSDAGSLWIDNISLVPANISYASPDDSILFFYNDTKANKTFTLPTGKGYIDVKQVSYSGSVTLTPFTSIILLYKNQLSTGINSANISAISSFLIYPNPANQLAIIKYTLKENSTVKISIYDVLGKEVLPVSNEKQSAGEHQLNLNTEQLQSGVYFIKMNVKEEQLTKKLIVSTFGIM